MSASLMSCVRENSPPLDVVDGANCSSNAMGPMSLPDCHTMSNVKQQQQQQQLTSTPLSVPNINECSNSGGGSGAGGGGDGTTQNTEPKRRRFHPLRNLRRIFRRRTITNVPIDTPPNINTTNTLPPPTSSTSEKNLRSATLSSISSVVSASSSSSPLTHQQLQDAYSSQSLPKSKSYSISGGTSGGSKAAQHRDALLTTVLGGKHKQQQQQAKQQLQQQQQQLEEVNVPDSDMYTTHASHTASSSMYHHHHHHHHHHHQTHQQVGSSGGVLFQPPHSVRQSLGVAVLPSAMNRSFYAERQKLRSIGDSSQELDSSGNDSGSANNTTLSGSGSGSGSGGGGSANGGGRSANGEISDSQRSLSEGRLVDSDYSHDPLSQSHDSVFSESASASLFSNRDYQAELSDVLRKRNRNRQDASEEDLGLPRSPASPQRRVERTQRSHHTTSGHNNNANANATATSSSATTGGNQSEVSSLSLLSMNSGDGDDLFASSTANNSTISTKEFVQERALSTSLGGRSLTRSSTVSTTSVTSEIYRHSSSGSLGTDSTRDEPDLLGAKCQRLSHSAAKHKMALRPAKKKGPSRMHRRTLETSIPEANEESLRLANNTLLDIKEHDVKAKTRSLPPSVTTKVLDQHAVESKKTTSPTKSAKTKSTTSSNEQILHVKRSKIEKLEKSNESGGKSTLNSTTTTTTNTANNSSSAITAATSLFGLRTLTAKATALFEPPQESSTDPTPSEQELKREKEREKLKEKEKIKEKEKETTNAAGVESSESGFLRRLIQRNSKRSGSRSNAAGNSNQSNDVKSDASQSVVDAKSKVQISTSCMDMKQTPESSLTKLDKSRSAMSYEQNIEETRKDIKQEIMSVGTTGLNAMLNTHKLTTHSEQSMKDTVTLSATTASPQKPKSGAAARQRYLPQDIGSLDRKLGVTASSSTTTATESYTSSTSSILSKCSQQEVFQSTSIIREITASQASSVNSVCSMSKSTEHHFEKKPKIVGLSAFQQKISRSNDSVGRFAGSNGSLSANSTTSLDAAGETRSHNIQEQKQRKIVEKSRSFRTYQEDAYNSASPAVHNNMPSLPDLTLNLRVPCYNEFAKDSPVAEARDLATTPRVNESTGNLTVNNYNFTKNITVKGTPSKLTPLSPVNSCATAELKAAQESTISSSDLLTKSPFINVLRKPTSSTSLEEKPVVLTVNASSSTRKSVEQINTTTKAAPVSLITVVPPQMPDLVKVEPQQQLQQQLRPKVLHLRDSNASMDTSTSTDDLRLTPTTAAVVSLREKPTKAKPSATVGNARNSMDLLAGAKDVERKSAPAPVAQTNKMQSVKTTKRSTSLMDSPPPANSPNGSEERSGVSKQIEPTSGSSSPNDDGVPEFMRIQLNRVDPARIAKSANVVLAKNVREIHTPNQQQPQAQQEKSPQQEKTPQVKSPQPQLTKEANGSERNTSLDELNLRRLSNESVEIIEKSSPTEVDKQKPVFELQAKSTSSAKSPTKTQVALSALPPRSPVKKQQSVVAITPTTPTTPTPDVEDSVLLRAKKPEPATPDASTLSSNKLSLQERKRLFMSEEKLKTDKRIEELRNERKKSITEEVYRKSFAKSEEKLDTGEKTPTEGVVMLRKKSFCAATNGKRDDPTPELMKVFARRSLKIKDEDINALADKLHASNGGSGGGVGVGNGGGSKKFTANQQNVDSDKENQSASEEKLDKLPKLEAPLELQSLGGGKLTNGMNNRNSLADFRSNKSTTVAAASNGCTNGLSLNNGNFNNNNHNSNNNNNNSNNNNHTAANSNSNNTSTTVNNTTANTNSTTTSTSTNGSLGVNVNVGGLSAGNRSSFLPTLKVAGFRNLPIERNNSVSKIYPTTACEALNNNNNNNNGNNLNNNHHQLGHGHHQPTHQLPSQQQNGKAHERQSLNMKALESNNSNNSNSSGGSSSSVLSSSSSSGGGGGGSGGSCKTIERSATVSEFKGIHQRRAEWEQRAKEALK